jgi:cysteine-rich repeat protein
MSGRHVTYVLFFLLAVAQLAGGSPVYAVTPAASPEDICLPTADPCVIDEAYEITAPTFDFGLRTVHMTGPAARLIGSVDVLCGRLLVDSGGNKIVVDLQEPGSAAGTFTVTAQRACSGDGLTPCLQDSTCAMASLGTCSVGDGSIFLDGEIQGNGDPGGTVLLRAAGDITVANAVRLSGADFETDGGMLDIESRMGNVTITGPLKVNAGAAGTAFGSSGGEISISAAGDVLLAERIELIGGSVAGTMDVQAGGDLIVMENVQAQGGQTVYASGGYLFFSAGSDLHISEPDRLGDTLITVDGGAGLYGEYGGVHHAPGYAGGLGLYADEDITVDDRTILSGQGGIGGCYGESLGANFYIYAEDGAVTLDGLVRSHGRGECGELGRIYVEAPGGINVGEPGFITVKSKRSGYISFKSDGPINIQGTLEAEGKLKTGGAYYAAYGYGGSISIRGATDLTIDGGSLLGGADGGGSIVDLSVCRLEMINNARIDNTHGAGEGEDRNYDNYVYIGESMFVEAGSKILADVLSDAENRIEHRDPNKPPVLEGTVDPAPLVSVNPSINGCPVCGNSEIDQGESCDDGNTTPGDFCNEACQDEGCIAQTPGYPTTALCDDSDACTLNLCDPVGHQCQNPVSCEEGVACTLDACVLGACEHTPNDALCDDANDCTDDVCNAGTGCVYANLTGSACEDGDLCTVTGVCQSGECVPSDPSFTERERIVASLKPGADNDRLKINLEMPDAEFNSNPVLTGLSLELFDHDDQSIFAATLDASDWEDTSGSQTQFRFRDSQGPGGPANGIGSASIKRKASTGTWKLVAKMRDTEIAGAAGQPFVSLSLLFGTDPSSDDCLTARRVPCTATSTKTSCKD